MKASLRAKAAAVPSARCCNATLLPKCQSSEKALYGVELVFAPNAESHTLHEKLFENDARLYRHIHHYQI